MSLGLKYIVSSVAVILVSLLLLITFGDNGMMELFRLQDRERVLVGQNETLARENVNLYRTIDRLKNDPLYIEHVARIELGMIGKNDLIIIRPDGGRQRK